MVTWKKWIIRSVVALLAFAGVVIGLGAIALDRLADNMCATSIFAKEISPDRKTQAVLFQIDCGATTGFNRQVSIVSSNLDLTKKNPDLQTSPFAAHGEPQVKMVWLSADRLEISYPENAKVLRLEPKSKGVAIEYKQSR